MKLFGYRKEATIEEVCQYFYDQVFLDLRLYVRVLDSITLGDTSIAIDERLLITEWPALCLELFGIAMNNHIYALSAMDEYRAKEDDLFREGCKEIMLVKHYLEPDSLDIWDVMSYYNNEIRRAHDMSYYGSWVDVTAVDSDEEQQRMQLRERLEALVGSNSIMRSGFSKDASKYIKDSECLDRFLNRLLYSNEKLWRTGYVSQRLTSTLIERLRLSGRLDWEGVFRTQALVFEAYNDAQHCIDDPPCTVEYEERAEQVRQILGSALKSIRERKKPRG